MGSSIPVELRLVRPGNVHSQVLGLVLGQFGELYSESVEVEARDLLVEVLGQRIDRGLYSPGFVKSSI